MARVIKKKKKQRTAPGSEDFETTFARVGDALLRKQRQLIWAAASFAVLIVLATGVLFYFRAAASSAQKYTYAGFKRYFGLYQDIPVVHSERARLALEEFADAYEAKPEPYSLLFVAYSHYDMGQYGEAMKALKELRAKFPEQEPFTSVALYKMAMVSLQEGRAEDALSFLETLSSSKSDSLKDLALMDAARILEGMGKKEEAREKYEALATSFPESPFAGQARAKAGLPEQGEGAQPEGKG
jgi:predicted negative regulator of RcsB-dependent stress response